MENNEEKHSPDLSSLLNSLLSNPETLSKIGATISKYTNEENATPPPPDSENNNNPQENNLNLSENDNQIANTSPTSSQISINAFAEKLPELLSLFLSSDAKNNPQSKQQIALLLAIKPYLSARRQELIDSFVKISQISDIIKKIT